MSSRIAGRVILIFIDGLGVGKKDPDLNPMARVMGPNLDIFIDGTIFPRPFDGIVKPLDTTLGVEGIPQSATGQTALLTGVNGAEALGYHLFGFPNKLLIEIIKKNSLLKQAKDAGLKPAFINAFRPKFFEMGDLVWTKMRLSVTTWVNHSAGLPFFSINDVANERSIYQDFTNTELKVQGFDLPVFSPEKAGSILAKQSRSYDLVLYEYFRTDAAGHRRQMDRAVYEIMRIEGFLQALLSGVDLESTLVILTSDHGNIEDLSRKSHTLNRALTLLFGAGAKETAESLNSLLDLPEAILHALGVSWKHEE